MKKPFFAFAVLLITASTGFAQRLAYVDIDYVLKNIPDYNNAQKQLDDIATGWQKEIDDRYTEIDKLYKSLQAEEVLLTPEMKQQRQKEIDDKEKAAKDLQKQRFGYQGDLFKKRQELIQPIQDRVYDAIQKIATTKSYDFVLDKSSGTVVLFASTKLNISDQVLQSLGYSSGKKPENSKGDNNSNSKDVKTADPKTNTTTPVTTDPDQNTTPPNPNATKPPPPKTTPPKPPPPKDNTPKGM